MPRHKLYGSLRVTSPTGVWAATDYNLASSYFVDDSNSAENDGWFTMDVRGGWDGEVNGWRIAPFVGVLNVFGERYVGSITVNARFGRFFEPSPPRNVYAGLEISPTLR